ncbi:MAG: cAMP-binding protein [Pedosphaera sp.]|nr:cAMP-binding protein [Pedosphaera sp.]
MSAARDSAVGYIIWGSDGITYGPVGLPDLVSWIKDGRVAADTWIFIEGNNSWKKACHILELQMFFHEKGAPMADRSATSNGVDTRILRRVKILAGLSDEQLDRFVKFMEIIQVFQWTQIVKHGEHGDAMYLILEGELRVRIMVDGRETTLATLGAGEFFGEISLIDQGPRSADVFANYESTLLKVSASDFEKLTCEAPDLAAPILFAIGKTLTGRIRADNKRYHDSVTLLRNAY